MIRFCHCRFQPFTPRKVTAAFNGGRLTSNGDVMLLPSRNFGSARRDARLILILAHHGRLDTSRRSKIGVSSVASRGKVLLVLFVAPASTATSPRRNRHSRRGFL